MDSKDFKEQYVLSMKAVEVNKDEIKKVLLEERKKRLSSYHVKWRRFSACACICFIIICIILTYPSTMLKNKKNTGFSIIAYAAEGNVESKIGKEPIIISNSVSLCTGEPYIMYNDDFAMVNYGLNFMCEGENVKKISYQLAGEKITDRRDLNNAEVWFSESYEISDEEYNAFTLNRESNYKIYRIWGDSKHDIFNCSSVIGTSYTVNYDEQKDKNYALEFKLYKDENNQLYADDILIDIVITLENGEEETRKIFIKPISFIQDDSYIDYQIEISEN